MSDDPPAGDADLLAKLIRALWLRTAPSQEAQRLRGELSTSIDDPRFSTWALDSLPDCVWDLIDVAVQRALDARDAELREACAEIERLQPVIAAARGLWRVGASLRDKLPALAAALDALDAQPQPREEPHA